MPYVSEVSAVHFHLRIGKLIVWYTYIQIRRFFFHQKRSDIFAISPRKHVLWVLIRSALSRRF